MIGKTLAHYEITSQLGKGGMGEVYQATDTKLGRDVAIKVLPEEFAMDADRVARFQREAKLLASLNHPNIAAIYGLEESSGTNFLVLELVEGETLADQLRRGPIPIEESLKLALQIAEALEAAHEKGVIHRDLKPANIKVTPGGKVKVLDFGLAKAFAGEQAEMNLSASPTLSHLATQQGIILGTAAYMSPEQAKGKIVDKRADIWAFGCVLYEMFTGQAAFQGEDVTEILAAVVKGGANLDLLPADTHPKLRELLSRCLQKDLKKRYRDIGDVLLELEQVLAHPGEPDARAKPEARLKQVVPWIIAIFGMLLGAVLAWHFMPATTPEPRQVTRFYYDLPKDQRIDTSIGYRRFLAISPDGKQFVYATTGGLFLRSMDEPDARLIPETGENPQNPFFSPDGKWIAYMSGSDNKLKKVALNDGRPVTLADLGDVVGSFSWGADDTIAFDTVDKGILRVSANGGIPEQLIGQGKDELLTDPQVLLDGKSVLITDAGRDPWKIVLYSLKSGEHKELFPGRSARYLPTGQILYAFRGRIMAVPFDLKTLKVTGRAVPVLEGIGRDTWSENALYYAIADSGTLIYVPADGIVPPASAQRTLVWVNPSGKEEPLAARPDSYQEPRISPDGRKIALAVSVGQGADIYVLDIEQKNLTKLTFDSKFCGFPLWTRDGRHIAYTSGTETALGIYLKAADGIGNSELLIKEGPHHFPASWSGDGKTLIGVEEFPMSNASSNTADIGALLIEGDRKWRPLLNEKYNEFQPRISPDGRWMAYTSNQSGKNEVYVCPFPDVNRGRWQVSPDGGNSPLWSPDGREIFYRRGDAAMAVSVKTNPAFGYEAPRTLFRGKYVSLETSDNYSQLNPWDIHPDGRRFLMMKESGAGASTAEGPRRINIVLNWIEELKQRVPGK